MKLTGTIRIKWESTGEINTIEAGTFDQAIMICAHEAWKRGDTYKIL